jgi:hypothetical protein
VSGDVILYFVRFIGRNIMLENLLPSQMFFHTGKLAVILSG